MVFLLNKDGVFECRKSEQGDNAGKGIFCVKEVKAGTILPYYGITISDEVDIDDDTLNMENYRTYVVSADYTTAHGNQRTAKGLSMDGDPRLPQINKLEAYKKLACQINEAGEGFLPNCLLVSNPNISRADIKGSLAKQVPIPVTYVVVTEMNNYLIRSETLYIANAISQIILQICNFATRPPQSHNLYRRINTSYGSLHPPPMR